MGNKPGNIGWDQIVKDNWKSESEFGFYLASNRDFYLRECHEELLKEWATCQREETLEPGDTGL